jgi:hypothetical protein
MVAHEGRAGLEVDIDELGNADVVGPDDPIQQEDENPKDLKGHDNGLLVSDE